MLIAVGEEDDGPLPGHGLRQSAYSLAWCSPTEALRWSAWPRPRERQTVVAPQDIVNEPAMSTLVVGMPLTSNSRSRVR